jgi:hypothetical protein
MKQNRLTLAILVLCTVDKLICELCSTDLTATV